MSLLYDHPDCDNDQLAALLAEDGTRFVGCPKCAWRHPFPSEGLFLLVLHDELGGDSVPDFGHPEARRYMAVWEESTSRNAPRSGK